MATHWRAKMKRWCVALTAARLQLVAESYLIDLRLTELGRAGLTSAKPALLALSYD